MNLKTCKIIGEDIVRFGQINSTSRKGFFQILLRLFETATNISNTGLG